MKATYPVLAYVVEKKLTKEFAFFLHLKSLYINSCIYNTKSLYRVAGCSRTKIDRIVKIIIAQNWGHYHKDHLILKSAKAIHYNLTGYHARNFVEINNKEDIELTLLKNKDNQKKYIKNKINDLNSRSKKAVKSALKSLGESKFVSGGMSVKIIGKVLNLSKSQACVTINRLEKLGLVQIERVRRCFGPSNPKSFSALQDLHSGCYLFKGFIYKNYPSKIDFLSYNNIL